MYFCINIFPPKQAAKVLLTTIRLDVGQKVESYCIVKVASRTIGVVDVVIRYLHWPHIEV